MASGTEDLDKLISIHALREEGDCLCLTSDVLPPRISIHALREEGDLISWWPTSRTCDFYPRPPRGGRPGAVVQGGSVVGISIHALREEGDTSSPSAGTPSSNFYPRPPRGGRRSLMLAPLQSMPFLSTPSARRATKYIETIESTDAISIHALREEGDRATLNVPSGPNDFYPRPPRGGRQVLSPVNGLPVRFLSTPSARRATLPF